MQIGDGRGRWVPAAAGSAGVGCGGVLAGCGAPGVAGGAGCAAAGRERGWVRGRRPGPGRPAQGAGYWDGVHCAGRGAVGEYGPRQGEARALTAAGVGAPVVPAPVQGGGGPAGGCGSARAAGSPVPVGSPGRSGKPALVGRPVEVGSPVPVGSPGCSGEPALVGSPGCSEGPCPFGRPSQWEARARWGARSQWGARAAGLGGSLAPQREPAVPPSAITTGSAPPLPRTGERRSPLAQSAASGIPASTRPTGRDPSRICIPRPGTASSIDHFTGAPLPSVLPANRVTCRKLNHNSRNRHTPGVTRLRHPSDAVSSLVSALL